MTTYVIDTSVIIKWFNQEDEVNIAIAHQIYADMVEDKIMLVAPSLLAIEVMNALKKGKDMPLSMIHKTIENLYALPLIIQEPTQGVLLQAAETMETYQLAAYDALFVATAKELECQLISDDQKGHGKITDGSIRMLEQYQSPSSI